MWNFFIKNSKFTKAIIVVLVLFGVYSITALPKESFPEIDVPFFVISIETTADTLEKTEDFVVRPIEAAVMSIDEVDTVTSSISEDRALISIVLDPAKDNKFIDSDIEKEAGRILDTNAFVSDYTMRRVSFNEFPSVILTIGFEGNRNEQEIIDLTQERLFDIEGIERIEVIGKDQEQVILLGAEKKVIPSAALAIYKSGSSNTIKLAKDVDETIEKLNREYKYRAHFLLSESLIGQVKTDLGKLLRSGLQTILFIFIILTIFLGWRSALLAGIAVPVTYLITFLVMLLTGQTINFLSLFSLLLSLGILIDSSIVVTEAFNRYVKRGIAVKDAAYGVVKNFAIPLTTGTLTTVMVFVPMLFMSGFIGLFMKPIPVTISIVLISSLFVALAAIPLYAKSLLKKRAVRKEIPVKKEGVSIKRYESLLKYLTKTKKRGILFLAGVFVVFLGVMALPASGALKVEMFPEGGSEYFYIDVEHEQVAKSDIHNEVEKILLSLQASNYIKFARVNYGVTGGVVQSPDDLSIVPEGRQVANITVTVTDPMKSGEVMAKYRNLIDYVVSDTTRAVIFQSEGGGTSGRPIDIIIASDNDTLRKEEAKKIEKILKGVSGVVDVVNDGEVNGGTIINRLNGKKVIHILADVNNTAELSDVFFELRKEIGDLETKKEVEISFGGEQEEINESFASLGIAMLAGIIAIYLLLLWQFNSYRQPLFILSTIPLALIGVFLGLLIIGETLSFPAFIGIVALSGIVVNNAIILLDKVNVNAKNGLPKIQAIVEASKSRLQPILLTAITTIFGILPLAIADPVWGPLGYTIIFGLAFSTILTLLVLPVIASRLGKFRQRK